MAGDEMVRQQHRLNRHEFEQTLEDGGEGNGNPLQCSHLGNPTDRRAWQAIVHRTVKSWIRLSGWTTTNIKTILTQLSYALSDLISLTTPLGQMNSKKMQYVNCRSLCLTS